MAAIDPQGPEAGSPLSENRIQYVAKNMRPQLANPGLDPSRRLSRPVIQKRADLPLAARKDGDFPNLKHQEAGRSASGQITATPGTASRARELN
jgi:hypothetical protein